MRKTMDKVVQFTTPKNYHIPFDYTRLFELKNDFLVDQFSMMDVPYKITARVLHEHVSEQDLTLEQQWEKTDHSAPFAEYLKYGFDAVRGKFNTCKEYYITFAGNYPGLPHKQGVGTHLHFKRPGRDICRTVTAIIPLNITEPVVENLRFQWTDVPFPELETKVWEKVNDPVNRRAYTKAFFKSVRAAKNNPIETISFPSQDEILVIDFNSYNLLHSANNFTNNTFLVFVFDDCL